LLDEPVVDQLGRAARLRERDRAPAVTDRLGDDAHGHGVRRDRHRVEKDDLAFRARRSRRLDDLHLTSDEVPAELRRVPDGGGGGDELRSRSVERAEPLQAGQDVVHVGAEDPAVDMHLVQHDVAQVGQHLPPVAVVRQDAEMQHVRVRDQHVRRSALDLAAACRRGVAVVDLEAGWIESAKAACQIAESGQLVLGQGLRRVEEQRTGAGVGRDRLQHRGREAQSLARGRRRHEQQVLPLPSQIERLGLVVIELPDTPLRERLLQRGRQRPLGARMAGGDPRQAPVVSHHRPQRGVFQQLFQKLGQSRLPGARRGDYDTKAP